MLGGTSPILATYSYCGTDLFGVFDLFDLIQCIAYIARQHNYSINFVQTTNYRIQHIYREHYYRNNIMSAMVSLLCYSKVMELCNYRSWIDVQINVTQNKIWTGQAYKSPWKTAVK